MCCWKLRLVTVWRYRHWLCGGFRAHIHNIIRVTESVKPLASPRREASHKGFIVWNIEGLKVRETSRSFPPSRTCVLTTYLRYSCTYLYPNQNLCEQIQECLIYGAVFVAAFDKNGESGFRVTFVASSRVGSAVCARVIQVTLWQRFKCV